MGGRQPQHFTTRGSLGITALRSWDSKKRAALQQHRDTSHDSRAPLCCKNGSLQVDFQGRWWAPNVNWSQTPHSELSTKKAFPESTRGGLLGGSQPMPISLKKRKTKRTIISPQTPLVQGRQSRGVGWLCSPDQPLIKAGEMLKW